MGRKQYGKELELLDRLKHENRKLKRDLKAARKLLDRYQVAEQAGLFDGEKILPSKKRRREKDEYEKWACYGCEAGTLILIVIGQWYLRQCNCCGKRTRRKKVHKDLVGIRKS